MAAVSTVVAVAGLALAAASTAYSVMSANAAASAAQDALTQQANLAYKELDRQQNEVGEIAGEKKGDRARMADKELSTLRAVMAEKGGLQTNTYDSLVQSVGYTEGMDLSRIDKNADRELASLRAQKQRVETTAQTQINLASREALNQSIGAGLQFVSTAAPIGYKLYRREEELKAARGAATSKPQS